MALIGNDSTELTWTGTGWVYVNGSYTCGPEVDGCTIPYTFTDTNAIEVHDQATDPAINEVPATRPIIRWTEALNALVDEYYIYHTPKGGSRELISRIGSNGEDTFYSIQVQEELDNGWHFFEVVSVYLGSESTVEAFPYRVLDLPPVPSDISAANGSAAGLFDITVTPGV